MNLTHPIFVVDGMHGSLARKLRMFGFDTLYYNDAEDDKLIDLALGEGRVLLTSDRTLYQRTIKAGAKSLLLTGAGDLDDIMKVLTGMGIEGVEFLPSRSRCPLCNGLLEERGKDSVGAAVPSGVLEKHSKFYLCGGCSKVYWEGSHAKKIIEFGRNVNRRLGRSG